MPLKSPARRPARKPARRAQSAAGDGEIDASIALHAGDRFLVGRDRIRLLEAVAEHGNITRAAQATGFSYKTAWDAVNAINNLLPTPAFRTRTGGRAGGGAQVTDEGRRLIATFHRLEARLTEISRLIAEEGLEGQDEALLLMFGARLSTRNVFQCEVREVARGPVEVRVTLRLSDAHAIEALVTNAAATSLALAPGRRALALIKAPFVALSAARSDGAVNTFAGEVVARVDDESSAEVRLDIGAGKTMTAVVPRVDADRLQAVVGARLTAGFAPAHVILAAN
ncbi:MAG: TOBE domain-containing protein [Rhizobiales bacterium]|nr:TOBE domain-containing protein [Hyphomicrobiales bacterium]